MSQENVEIVRRAIDAYNRRDVDTLQALGHPDSKSIGGVRQPAPADLSRAGRIPGRFIESGDAVVVLTPLRCGAATV